MSERTARFLQKTFDKPSLFLRPFHAILNSIVVLAALTCPTFGFAQDAPRPATEDLLPETTVAFFQVDNLREAAPKLFGREFLEDENVAPFLDRMYQEAESAYGQIPAGEGKLLKDEVGMSLEQIRDLPTGEMCMAVIAPRRKDLEFLIAMDLDPESESVQLATDFGKKVFELNEEGETIESDAMEEGVEIHSVNLPEGSLDKRTVYWLLRDSWFVACTSKPELLDLLERWEGREVKKVRPLSQNRKFVTIMNRCRETKEIQPDFRFFIDPLSLTRSSLRGNAGAQVALNFLPVLGLDGVLGVGGSAVLEHEVFQQVFHAHLLLANPKAGLLKALALKPGDCQPHPWVPEDCTNYFTTNWDAKQAWIEAGKITTTFYSPDAIEHFKSEFLENTTVDFETEIIGNLSGRITWLQWSEVDGPWLANGTCQALAIGLKDTDAVEQIIEKILGKIREETGEDSVLEEEDKEGIHVWYGAAPTEGRRFERLERRRERMGDLTMRIPQPAFCLLDGHLIFCDSKDMLFHLIETNQGDHDSLADNVEYARNTEHLLKAAGTDLPCLMAFSNPQNMMRDLIRLANHEDSKSFLMNSSERVPALAGLKQALDEQPVPDFESVAKYFRTSGAIVTTDDTGYHMLGYQLRNDDETE